LSPAASGDAAIDANKNRDGTLANARFRLMTVLLPQIGPGDCSSYNAALGEQATL
jgi:hypothetical protein